MVDGAAETDPLDLACVVVQGSEIEVRSSQLLELDDNVSILEAAHARDESVILDRRGEVDHRYCGITPKENEPAGAIDESALVDGDRRQADRLNTNLSIVRIAMGERQHAESGAAKDPELARFPILKVAFESDLIAIV